LRERNPLAKPDFLGAFGLLIGLVVFFVYWQAGTMGLTIGYILNDRRKRRHKDAPAGSLLLLLPLGGLLVLALWVGIDYWQFFTLGLMTWLFLRMTRIRVVTLRVSLPDSLGSAIRMNQAPVKLFVQSKAWERRGGGTGVLYGRRVGKRSTLGFGGWSSSSITSQREYFEGYTGASVLTEKSLVFVDRGGITRVAVALKDIVASTLSTDSDRKLVVSYGRGIPKTLVLEYMAKGKGEAARVASEWYHAISSSITQVAPIRVRSVG
jgi:hypothetical protein